MTRKRKSWTDTKSRKKKEEKPSSATQALPGPATRSRAKETRGALARFQPPASLAPAPRLEKLGGVRGGFPGQREGRAWGAAGGRGRRCACSDAARPAGGAPAPAPTRLPGGRRARVPPPAQPGSSAASVAGPEVRAVAATWQPRPRAQPCSEGLPLQREEERLPTVNSPGLLESRCVPPLSFLRGFPEFRNAAGLQPPESFQNRRILPTLDFFSLISGQGLITDCLQSSR